MGLSSVRRNLCQTQPGHASLRRAPRNGRPQFGNSGNLFMYALSRALPTTQATHIAPVPGQTKRNAFRSDRWCAHGAWPPKLPHPPSHTPLCHLHGWIRAVDTATLQDGGRWSSPNPTQVPNTIGWLRYMDLYSRPLLTHFGWAQQHTRTTQGKCRQLERLGHWLLEYIELRPPFAPPLTATIHYDSIYAYGVSTRLSTPTCNNGLVEMVARLVDRVRSRIQLTFQHVKGHSGEHGNEVADRLAERRDAFAHFPTLHSMDHTTRGTHGTTPCTTEASTASKSGPSTTRSSASNMWKVRPIFQLGQL